MTYPETKLDRAVRRAVEKVNRDFLNDPEAQRQAAENGLRAARAIEAQLRGFVQKTDERGYPTETLDEFAARAGTDTWNPIDGYSDNFEVLR
jgi:hypothetical protein